MEHWVLRKKPLFSEQWLFRAMARFNPGLLADRTRMAGFRIEIRAIGSAAADRA